MNKNKAKKEEREKKAAAYITPESKTKISDKDVKARMRSLENQVARLSRENTELEEELSFALEQSKEEAVAISSENWNLELASKQYNEAKRQMDRLGQQIRKERAQCTAEKKELEI